MFFHQAIKITIGISAAENYGKVLSDRLYQGVNSEVIEVMDSKCFQESD